MEDPTKIKGIIPYLIGGLGNQMFIISAGFVISQIQGCPLWIPTRDVKDNIHNKHALNYNNTVFKYIGTHHSLQEKTMIEDCLKTSYKQHPPNKSAFHPWSPLSILPGSVLKNFYQYYPPLEPFEDDIRAVFLKGLEETSQRLLQIKGSIENTAFLHVRRGDYINSSLHCIQSIDYYQKAVSMLPTSIKYVYCFSDDVEWLEQQELFRNPKFKIQKDLNEIETLALMSLCTNGAICANSTLSWWGAFLGSHAKRSPVYVPKQWINMEIFSLFPENWIKL